MDKKLLKIFFGFGLLLVPFAFRRENLKTLLLTFFLKGYISSFLDQVVVKKKQVVYPTRNFPKFFKTSILFDYLLLPLLCVFYFRTTQAKKFWGTVLSVFYYTLPVTLVEGILEKKTRLINYKNTWSRWVSFTTLTLTFWFVRGLVTMVTKLNVEGSSQTQKQAD